MDITLQLTLDEVNVILKALAKQPFEVVSDVITKVRAQGQEQIKINEAAQAVTDTPEE